MPSSVYNFCAVGLFFFAFEAIFTAFLPPTASIRCMFLTWTSWPNFATCAESSQDGLVTCFLAWFHGRHFNLSGRKVGLVCHSIGHGEFQEDVSQPCATSFNICSGPGFQTQALFEMRQVCIDRKMIYAYFTGWYSFPIWKDVLHSWFLVVIV